MADMTPEQIAAVAGKLSRGAKVALLHGAGCNNHDELVKAGLWTPEPGCGHPYYIKTPLGLAVRAHLEKESRL